MPVRDARAQTLASWRPGRAQLQPRDVAEAQNRVSMRRIAVIERRSGPGGRPVDGWNGQDAPRAEVRRWMNESVSSAESRLLNLPNVDDAQALRGDRVRPESDAFLNWSHGGRSANPCTPVRFRARPPVKSTT